ncbi:zonadhesin-like [Tubulanus polymorphus]|uniref:zonadhesin-like n=1 Tax=Tubulanus polymorphus TaxID=672921 RepID=UPI003DA47BBC
MFGLKGVTFPREVDVKINGAVIRMLGEENMYKLKGKDQKSFGQKLNGKEEQDKNQFWKVMPGPNGLTVNAWDKCGLKVEYDGTFVAIITVVSKYAGKLKGMCGNCNGKSADDWTTKSNKLLTTASIEKRTVILGDSWIVTDDSSNPSKSCTTSASPPVKCKDNLKDKLTSGKSQCGRLKESYFAACSKKLPHFEDYYNDCYYDACSMYNKNPKIAPVNVMKAVCSTISEVATLCISKNVAVTGWRNDFCPKKCGENMEYKYKVTECMNTCNEPNAAKDCSIGETEGCVCKSGFVFDDGKCIKQSSCPT